MGNTIWVDVRDRSMNDVPQDNSIMLRLEGQLDRLSARLNVPKLSEFYDYSESESMYDDADDEGDEAEHDESFVEDGRDLGLWFDPSPALAAVLAIHRHLNEHPNDLDFAADPSQAHWPGDLMDELGHCRSVLEGAVSRGQRFRFLIVP
jgi:hypothetical protein